MAKIHNISEIHPTLGFTEFDILEKYRKSFNESELGKLHSVFPFECMAKAAGLSDRRLGRRNRFSPSAKIALMVLKAYTGFSDRQLVEHLNGNIHYQIFCGIMIPPSLPITNFKIVSAIRNEIASRLDIDSFQELLASHWKPYLDNLHVCMTDATCYESHMRFPTDMKLLWESLEWLYRHICRHCRELGGKIGVCCYIKRAEESVRYTHSVVFILHWISINYGMPYIGFRFKIGACCYTCVKRYQTSIRNRSMLLQS